MKRAGLKTLGLRPVGVSTAGLTRPGSGLSVVADPIEQWFADTGADGLYLRYDSDESLYQDAALTQPAAISDPVGGWTDLSGNGYAAEQTTPSQRPLRTADVVLFDGVDDQMDITPTPLFGSGDFALLLLAEQTLGGAGARVVLSTRASGGLGDAIGWQLRTQADGNARIILDSGNTSTSLNELVTGPATGMVLRTVVLDRSAGTVTGKTNGIVGSVVSASGLGVFDNPDRPLRIGEAASFAGPLRALVVVNRADIEPVEQALLELLP